MAYTDLTLPQLTERFGLEVRRQANLVRDLPPVPISDWLKESLRRMGPAALDVNTEKARSEFLIAPMLAEVREQLDETVSLFSGIDLNVDSERGLRGVCDFVIGLTPQQLILEAPLAVVVEAKNENIPRGVVQCLAELVAVREFNQSAGKPLNPLLGAVSNGNLWKFIRLAGDTATVDLDEYYLVEVDRIVGIMVALLRAGQADLAARSRSPAAAR